MKPITPEEIKKTAKQIHSIALKAIQKTEGYSDGSISNYENRSDRLHCAMEAIAKHILENFTRKRKRKLWLKD